MLGRVPARWRLNRAGIVNVYQYGDEILHFAGGRLLLRGVNGSGKSTAMNMLLPFLFEADTRRIDAAGDQQGVLRSWMLSGRDDPQPVGYLWIEVRRDDEYLVCGCGIRANRSTEKVSTWWFVTSRRPGVDLDLVEKRTPLSAEALRATLSPDPVFRHDQRGAYRGEVRQRLFGGADTDQHVRLLHVVRNPRVGDRIDVDLAQYLGEALPQLSDDALDDAAQPLDDLEQHRKNLDALERTHATLRALLSVYANYARAELHRRAGVAGELVAASRAAERVLVDARREAAATEARLADAVTEVRELEAEERRTREELDALRRSPAYQDAGTLADLRALVVSLSDAIERAADDARRQSVATARARDSLAAAAQGALDDQGAVEAALRELAACLADARVPAEIPEMPRIVTAPLPAPAPHDADPALEAPSTTLDVDPILQGLATVRGAVMHRRGDVEEVRRELRSVEDAAQRLDAARRRWESAREESGIMEEAAGEARRELDTALRSWRERLVEWVARLDAHRREGGLGPVASVDLETELLSRREELVSGLQALVDATMEHLLGERASLDARRSHERAELDDLEEVLSALERQTVPRPPSSSWQRADRATVLAEVVDFRESVSAHARAGLEGAMEAAGLLGAELTADGALVVEEGGLALRAGPPVGAPLSQLLQVDVAEGVDPPIGAAAIARLLDAISTDPGDLTGGGGRHGEDVPAVVTVDGAFRIGLLQGRHGKAVPEHIGSAARRAALDRQRAEARHRRDDALGRLEKTDARLAVVAARLEEAAALRAALPAGEAVFEASVRAARTEADWERARAREAERLAGFRLADELHAEAVDKSRRVAANLHLPATAEELRDVEGALRDAVGAVSRSEDRCRALARSAGAWTRAGGDWRRAADDERHARGAYLEAVARHEPEAARLATLEDAIGIAAAEAVAAVETCEAGLRRVATALVTARQVQLDRSGEVVSAKDRVDECDRRRAAAERDAVDALPVLRRALAVPGLLDAALMHGEPDGAEPSPVSLAPVAETPQGVAALVREIESLVPPATRAEAGADGVRQSLRQRRADLGSGWDAEDRQADESVPLGIEVNGPQGRMPLAQAALVVGARLSEIQALLSREQDNALRNLLQGLVAKEVAEKMQSAADLVAGMNRRLDAISTAHGIGVALRWRRREGLEPGLDTMIDLLAKPPDLRTGEQDAQLRAAMSARLDEARRDDPEAPYRDLVAQVLDYRTWHELRVMLRRPGRPEERLSTRTALSEGEKKIVSYLPLFAAVAASCDSIAERDPTAPRFVLLDDAFAKVSEDNHAKLFGLLVELDLDFIATSERLWGTHASVPELAITEVVRDADMGVIVLEHSRWDGRRLEGAR